jgi:hypothetical protein
MSSMAVGIMKPENGRFYWAKHQNWQRFWREVQEVDSPCPLASEQRKTRRNMKAGNLSEGFPRRAQCSLPLK